LSCLCSIIPNEKADDTLSTENKIEMRGDRKLTRRVFQVAKFLGNFKDCPQSSYRIFWGE
jgi:hypothetical protein